MSAIRRLVVFVALAVACTAGVTAASAAGAVAAPARAPKILSCSGSLVYEPSDFIISCADANAELTATHWARWTSAGAAGVTRFGLNLCTPYCAASPIRFFPESTVELSRPVSTRHGLLFSLLTVRYRLAGVAKSFSFSWMGDPSFAALGKAKAVVATCAGSQLIGNFSVVRSSAGAGNITYALELINHSSRPCALAGLPHLQLRGSGGLLLPTHVVRAVTGSGAAARLVLRPGAPAWASARFSPDVPGTGEPARGQCEPTARSLRVSGPSPSSPVVVAVRPPTPVCEHGTMQVSVFSSVRPTS
jgi:hypothetical protein